MDPNSESQRHRLLAIFSRERLVRVLRYMLDDKEFLSPFGIRSLSLVHKDCPVEVNCVCTTDELEEIRRVIYEGRYIPEESEGNTSDLGPIWLGSEYNVFRYETEVWGLGSANAGGISIFECLFSVFFLAGRKERRVDMRDGQRGRKEKRDGGRKGKRREGKGRRESNGNRKERGRRRRRENKGEGKNRIKEGKMGRRRKGERNVFNIFSFPSQRQLRIEFCHCLHIFSKLLTRRCP